MAFSHVGNLGTALSSANNQATLVLTTTATAAADSIVVVLVAVDNAQTTDGDSTAVSGVVDSAGNTYTRNKGFANGQGTAQTGADISIWSCKLTTQLSSGGTITATFANATTSDASAMTAKNFAVGAGNDYAVEGTPGSLAADAAAVGSLNVTTSNIECLRVRAIASESNSSTALTATAGGWAVFDGAVSGAGTSATEMGVRGEWLISTGTGSASNPTGGAGSVDHASAYVAYREVVIISGSGTPDAQNSTVAGSGVSLSTGTGSPDSQSSVVDGEGTATTAGITGTGVLLSQSSGVDGEGEVVARLSTNYDRIFGIGQVSVSSGSRAPTALNSAYVHATSGDAVAVRYLSRSTEPIDELYVFLDVVTGTLGSITMACNIYNEHASSITQPGSTLRDTATAVVMPNAADKWIKFTFGSPYTPSVGEVLWLVVHNTAVAPTTDFPSLMTGSNCTTPHESFGAVWGVGFVTAAGFSTAGTISPEVPWVVKQGTSYYGKPATQFVAVFANNSLRRGIVLDVPCPMILFGFAAFGTSAYTNLEIYDGSTAPGGSALHTIALGVDSGEALDDVMGTKIFDTPITLMPGYYKAVFTVSANSTNPTGIQVEDYASYPAVFDGLINGFTVCGACVDNGAGGWTIDNGFYPSLRLLVDEILKTGDGMLMQPGMSGGFT